LFDDRHGSRNISIDLATHRPATAVKVGQTSHMQGERRTIVAVTSAPSPESDQHDWVGDAHAGVRRRAAELGKAGATIILFDLAADSGPLESPLPTNWSAEGEQEQFGSRLSPNDLEAAGRHHLAQQVQSLRATGVQAYGWLPDDSSGSGLLRYAEEQGASLIVVSDSDEQLRADLADHERPPGIEIETVAAPER